MLLLEDMRRTLSPGETGGPDLDDGEEFSSISDRSVSLSATCIVIVLVGLTIGFEYGEDRVEDETRAKPGLRPLVDSLYKELAILGFLSALTFVASDMGVFRDLSSWIFGEEQEDFLEELFELIHYCLFFIMVYFIIQVWVFTKQAFQTEKHWVDLNRACQDPEYMERLIDSIGDDTRAKTKVRKYIERLIKAYGIEKVNPTVFRGMRSEFLKQRAPGTSSRLSEPEESLPSDFDYSKYLSACQYKTMASVVDISIPTWIAIIVFALFFYAITALVHFNLVVLSWIWVGIAIFVHLFDLYFERHLIHMRDSLAASPDEPNAENAQSDAVRFEKDRLSERVDKRQQGTVEFGSEEGERKKLMSSTGARASSYTSEEDDELSPKASNITNIANHRKKRPLVLRLLSSMSMPQMSERKCRQLNMLIVQFNMVYIGVYCVVLAITFGPAMHNYCGRHWFLAYVIISVVLAAVLVLNKGRLLATMTIVESTGRYRRARVVDDVIREGKVAGVVQKLLMFGRVYRVFQRQQQGPKGQDQDLDQDQQQQLGAPPSAGGEYVSRDETTDTAGNKSGGLFDLSLAFDSIDKNGQGVVDKEDLLQIICKVYGNQIDTSRMEETITAADMGKDGKISKEDFLQWCSQSIEKDGAMTLTEQAQYLFNLFDRNNSGGISLDEFRSFLDQFPLYFSAKEMEALIHEFDGDDGDDVNHGVIRRGDFVNRIRKYDEVWPTVKKAEKKKIQVRATL